MAILSMVGHHGFSALVVVLVSCRDGEIVRHVG